MTHHFLTKWTMAPMARITGSWLLLIAAVLGVCTGTNRSCAQAQEGELVGWGSNEFGQRMVPAGNDFVAVTGGLYHSLALRSDGTLAGWGRNDLGQTTVPSGSDFVAVAAGGYHSLALRSGGTLAIWGSTNHGQQTNVPVGSDFVAVSAGIFHSRASARSSENLIGPPLLTLWPCATPTAAWKHHPPIAPASAIL